MLRYFSFLFVYFILSTPALAADTPLPQKKTDSLQEIQKRMSEEKAHQEELKSQAQKIENDMKGLKNDLISTTRKVQKQEQDLQELEQKLTSLQKQKDDLNQSLMDDKDSLADLILALERIRRLPPETLIARPDAPLETAQAATILSYILPEVDRRAAKLKSDLDELSRLETELVKEKEKQHQINEKLKQDQSYMNNLIAEREKSLRTTNSKMKQKEVEIANLSKEAKNFQDLIKKIEEKNRELEEKERTAAQAAASRQQTSPSSTRNANLPALGTGRPPVSGIVKTRFGEKDDLGATSQGITFQSRPGAVVIAPMGGIVRYAGDFRSYGKIVLLEHKNKFHSLVAGLGKIDTVVGQRVEAGEPIGSLPGDSGRLYFEMRSKGEPVNPSQKFANLE